MTRSRKAKNTRKQIGRKHRRVEPKTILIVTEGKKTETDYFDKLIQKLRAGADIEGTGKGDSAPTSVVKRAEKAIRRDSSEYEVVYCVFDRDSHADYEAAIKMINKLNQSNVNIEINAVPSVPCIECWFYLHKKYLNKPYATVGSPAADLLRDLKQIPEFRDYDKSIPIKIFNYLFENRNDAKENAIRTLEDGKQRGDKEYHENPSTRVHLVVEKLEENVSKK